MVINWNDVIERVLAEQATMTKSGEEDRDDPVIVAARTDLRKWRDIATKYVRSGRPVREFHSEAIPAEIKKYVDDSLDHLTEVSGPDRELHLRVIFAKANEMLREPEKRGLAADEFAKALGWKSWADAWQKADAPQVHPVQAASPAPQATPPPPDGVSSSPGERQQYLNGVPGHWVTIHGHKIFITDKGYVAFHSQHAPIAPNSPQFLAHLHQVFGLGQRTRLGGNDHEFNVGVHSFLNNGDMNHSQFTVLPHKVGITYQGRTGYRLRLFDHNGQIVATDRRPTMRDAEQRARDMIVEHHANVVQDYAKHHEAVVASGGAAAAAKPAAQPAPAAPAPSTPPAPAPTPSAPTPAPTPPSSGIPTLSEYHQSHVAFGPRRQTRYIDVEGPHGAKVHMTYTGYGWHLELRDIQGNLVESHDISGRGTDYARMAASMMLYRHHYGANFKLPQGAGQNVPASQHTADLAMQHAGVSSQYRHQPPAAAPPPAPSPASAPAPTPKPTTMTAPTPAPTPAPSAPAALGPGGQPWSTYRPSVTVPPPFTAQQLAAMIRRPGSIRSTRGTITSSPVSVPYERDVAPYAADPAKLPQGWSFVQTQRAGVVGISGPGNWSVQVFHGPRGMIGELVRLGSIKATIQPKTSPATLEGFASQIAQWAHEVVLPTPQPQQPKSPPPKIPDADVAKLPDTAPSGWNFQDLPQFPNKRSFVGPGGYTIVGPTQRQLYVSTFTYDVYDPNGNHIASHDAFIFNPSVDSEKTYYRLAHWAEGQAGASASSAPASSAPASSVPAPQPAATTAPAAPPAPAPVAPPTSSPDTAPAPSTAAAPATALTKQQIQALMDAKKLPNVPELTNADFKAFRGWHKPTTDWTLSSPQRGTIRYTHTSGATVDVTTERLDPNHPERAHHVIVRDPNGNVVAQRVALDRGTPDHALVGGDRAVRWYTENYLRQTHPTSLPSVSAPSLPKQIDHSVISSHSDSMHALLRQGWEMVSNRVSGHLVTYRDTKTGLIVQGRFTGDRDGKGRAPYAIEVYDHQGNLLSEYQATKARGRDAVEKRVVQTANMIQAQLDPRAAIGDGRLPSPPPPPAQPLKLNDSDLTAHANVLSMVQMQQWGWHASPITGGVQYTLAHQPSGATVTTVYDAHNPQPTSIAIHDANGNLVATYDAPAMDARSMTTKLHQLANWYEHYLRNSIAAGPHPQATLIARSDLDRFAVGLNNAPNWTFYSNPSSVTLSNHATGASIHAEHPRGGTKQLVDILVHDANGNVTHRHTYVDVGGIDHNALVNRMSQIAQWHDAGMPTSQPEAAPAQPTRPPTAHYPDQAPVSNVTLTRSDLNRYSPYNTLPGGWTKTRNPEPGVISEYSHPDGYKVTVRDLGNNNYQVQATDPNGNVVGTLNENMPQRVPRGYTVGSFRATQIMDSFGNSMVQWLHHQHNMPPKPLRTADIQESDLNRFTVAQPLTGLLHVSQGQHEFHDDSGARITSDADFTTPGKKVNFSVYDPQGYLVGRHEMDVPSGQTATPAQVNERLAQLAHWYSWNIHPHAPPAPATPATPAGPPTGTATAPAPAPSTTSTSSAAPATPTTTGTSTPPAASSDAPATSATPSASSAPATTLATTPRVTLTGQGQKLTDADLSQRPSSNLQQTWQLTRGSNNEWVFRHPNGTEIHFDYRTQSPTTRYQVTDPQGNIIAEHEAQTPTLNDAVVRMRQVAHWYEERTAGQPQTWYPTVAPSHLTSGPQESELANYSGTTTPAGWSMHRNNPGDVELKHSSGWTVGAWGTANSTIVRVYDPNNNLAALTAMQRTSSQADLERFAHQASNWLHEQLTGTPPSAAPVSTAPAPATSTMGTPYPSSASHLTSPTVNQLQAHGGNPLPHDWTGDFYDPHTKSLYIANHPSGWNVRSWHTPQQGTKIGVYDPQGNHLLLTTDPNGSGTPNNLRLSAEAMANWLHEQLASTPQATTPAPASGAPATTAPATPTHATDTDVEDFGTAFPQGWVNLSTLGQRTISYNGQTYDAMVENPSTGETVYVLTTSYLATQTEDYLIADRNGNVLATYMGDSNAITNHMQRFLNWWENQRGTRTQYPLVAPASLPTPTLADLQAHPKNTLPNGWSVAYSTQHDVELHHSSGWKVDAWNGANGANIRAIEPGTNRIVAATATQILSHPQLEDYAHQMANWLHGQLTGTSPAATPAPSSPATPHQVGASDVAGFPTTNPAGWESAPGVGQQQIVHNGTTWDILMENPSTGEAVYHDPSGWVSNRTDDYLIADANGNVLATYRAPATTTTDQLKRFLHWWENQRSQSGTTSQPSATPQLSIPSQIDHTVVSSFPSTTPAGWTESGSTHLGHINTFEHPAGYKVVGSFTGPVGVNFRGPYTIEIQDPQGNVVSTYQSQATRTAQYIEDRMRQVSQWLDGELKSAGITAPSTAAAPATPSTTPASAAPAAQPAQAATPAPAPPPPPLPTNINPSSVSHLPATLSSDWTSYSTGRGTVVDIENRNGFRVVAYRTSRANFGRSTYEIYVQDRNRNVVAHYQSTSAAGTKAIKDHAVQITQLYDNYWDSLAQQAEQRAQAAKPATPSASTDGGGKKSTFTLPPPIKGARVEHFLDWVKRVFNHGPGHSSSPPLNQTIGNKAIGGYDKSPITSADWSEKSGRGNTISTLSHTDGSTITAKWTSGKPATSSDTGQYAITVKNPQGDTVATFTSQTARTEDAVKERVNQVTRWYEDYQQKYGQVHVPTLRQFAPYYASSSGAGSPHFALDEKSWKLKSHIQDIGNWLASRFPTLIGAVQNSPHHDYDKKTGGYKNVDPIQHTLRVIDPKNLRTKGLGQRDAELLRLAAVLHDVGKQNGNARDPNHPRYSADHVKDLLWDWNLTPQEYQTVHTLVKWHDAYGEAMKNHHGGTPSPSDPGVDKLAKLAKTPEMADMLMRIWQSDVDSIPGLSKNGYGHIDVDAEGPKWRDAVVQRINQLKASGQLPAPDPLPKPPAQKPAAAAGPTSLVPPGVKYGELVQLDKNLPVSKAMPYDPNYKRPPAEVYQEAAKHPDLNYARAFGMAYEGPTGRIVKVYHGTNLDPVSDPITGRTTHRRTIDAILQNGIRPGNPNNVHAYGMGVYTVVNGAQKVPPGYAAGAVVVMELHTGRSIEYDTLQNTLLPKWQSKNSTLTRTLPQAMQETLAALEAGYSTISYNYSSTNSPGFVVLDPGRLRIVKAVHWNTPHAADGTGITWNSKQHGTIQFEDAKPHEKSTRSNHEYYVGSQRPQYPQYGSYNYYVPHYFDGPARTK